MINSTDFDKSKPEVVMNGLYAFHVNSDEKQHNQFLEKRQGHIDNVASL